MGLNGSWIEIFKVGSHGKDHNWTEGDLDAIAKSYDPVGVQPAPIVVGHPNTDSPAYGVVAKLRRSGQSLWAQIEKVEPQFEQLLREGRFLSRSVAIYKNLEATGTPYLRHLGFLGAAAPAVKGLVPIQFKEGEVDAFEFSLPIQEEAMPKDEPKNDEQFSDEQKSWLQKALDNVVAKFSKSKATTGDVADPVQFTEAQVKEVVADALKKSDEKHAASFKDLEEKLTKQATTQAAQTAGAQVSAFAEKMNAKSIPPITQGAALVIAGYLAASPATVKFKEGEGDDAEEIEKPVLALFEDLVLNHATSVPTGSTGAEKISQLPEGYAADGVDPESVELMAFAETIAKEEKVEYAEALMIARQRKLVGRTGKPSAGKA